VRALLAYLQRIEAERDFWRQQYRDDVVPSDLVMANLDASAAALPGCESDNIDGYDEGLPE